MRRFSRKQAHLRVSFHPGYTLRGNGAWRTNIAEMEAVIITEWLRPRSDCYSFFT